jgi:hypothetical protein
LAALEGPKQHGKQLLLQPQNQSLDQRLRLDWTKRQLQLETWNEKELHSQRLSRLIGSRK